MLHSRAVKDVGAPPRINFNRRPLALATNLKFQQKCLPSGTVKKRISINLLSVPRAAKEKILIKWPMKPLLKYPETWLLCTLLYGPASHWRQKATKLKKN